MDCYRTILESWLRIEKPQNINGAINFYSPRKDKPRYVVIDKPAFHRYPGRRFHVDGTEAFDTNENEVDAILIKNPILCNGCVIHNDNLFSESISRNISGQIKLDPFLPEIINRKSALKQWYRYCHYDPQSNTAAIPEVSAAPEIISGNHFLFNSLDGQINFGHFIHDTLSQIAIFNSVKKMVIDFMFIYLG